MFTYPIGDVYPTGFAYLETGNSTAVTDDTAEALHVDSKLVEASKQKANSKSILLAMGVIACMAIFFGMGD